MSQKKYSLTFSSATETCNSNINEIEASGESINSDKTNDKINNHISIIGMFGETKEMGLFSTK